METIYDKVRDRQAKTAVIGLGYVGLPLAVEMASAGFATVGIDVSEERVDKINRSENYIADISPAELRKLVEQGLLSASTDFSVLRDADFISICVPTPLGKGKIPDISYILSAAQQVKRFLRPGHVIILESTTYPGTTEEVVLPLLQETGLKVGHDFFLAFSPERIDPGNKTYSLRNTPKVIGGITPNCTEAAQSLYQTFIDEVIIVSSTQSAEMVKILENTFRAVNIGLANEIAIMCNRMNINTWEVIDAAASKPFGFMPFYPGPGLGGHCIPVDPHYLVWKLKSLDYHPRFIQLADEINSSMPHLVVDKVVDALNKQEKAVKNSRLLVLGVSYKKDVDDYRESPALQIIRLLQRKEAHVFYHDPYVPELTENGICLKSVPIIDLKLYDCIIIVTDHSCFDIEKIVMGSQTVVDTRNATRNLLQYKDKISRI